MYKKSVSMLVVLLLIFSPLALAQANETDTCTGFFSSIKCLLFGNPSQRPVAGSAWYDRGVSLPWYEPEGGALVGKTTYSDHFTWSCSNDGCICQNPTGCFDMTGNLRPNGRLILTTDSTMANFNLETINQQTINSLNKGSLNNIEIQALAEDSDPLVREGAAF